MRRTRLWMATAAIGLVLGACSSPANPGTAGAGVTRFDRPGPFAVGVTTLDLGAAGSLGERMATVYYPADPATAASRPRYSYKLGDPLPPALLAIVPAKYDSTVTTSARVGAPASRRGPFPVVLFSHGFGAARLFYSQSLTGVASWGFVVVSADYLERGLLAQATQSKVPDSPSLDLQVMFSSLSAAEAASADRSSPMAGTVDARRIAVAGHSAGGQTAFDALRDPRVKVAVGWAPVGPSGAPSRKPVTIIGAEHDVALTPAELTKEYHAFPGPTTLVEISNEGHNTFTDLCPSIRDGGGGLVGFARSLGVISGELATLAVNGCTSANLPAPRFWPIVQAYTVAALRQGLGIDAVATPSAPPASAFPGLRVTVRHHG